MYDVVLEKIIQFISDTPSIRNILDVGCGEGFYARQIQQRTERNIFAFDLSREAIQIASKKDKRKAVKWFVTDLSKIPLKDGSMDCILDIFSPAHYKEFQLSLIHILCREFSTYREDLDEIVELMVETVCAKRKTTRIAGSDFPHEVVRSRFLKLDSEHIRFVMDLSLIHI